MRRIILSLFLLFVWAGSAQAQLLGLKPEITGAWYNPAQDGHGFNIQALDDNTLLIFWYTYRPDGTSTFLLGTATINGMGMYTGILSQTEGMTFGSFNPMDNSTFEWGTITLEFTDCDSGIVSWQSGIAGYPSGSIPIQRLTTTNLGTCVNEAAAGNFAITYAEDGDRLSGTALFLPNGDLYYAVGVTELQYIGVGAWRQTGRLNVTIESISYELNDAFSPPLDTEPYNTAVVLNINGFGDLASSAIALPRLKGVTLRDYRRNVALASLAGTYNLIDTASSFSFGTVNIAADGSITGSAINGCNLGGQIEQTSPRTNQFSLRIEANDPASLCDNSDLMGAGYLIDAEDAINPNDLFTILINEDTEYASVFRLDR